MARRRLPIGIQTFRKLREANAYYVDKTPYIERLLDEGTHYFLSRPRRFGKSLFLDTLKELFEGNEPLLAGLHVHDRRDWSLRNPVLRLTFGGNYAEPGYLQEDLNDQLEALEERMGVPARRSSGPIRFRRLITSAHERTGRRVVVLVDEYDKPLLDVLDTPRLARANRDFLRGRYGTIEQCDEHVRFAFITGVSKFSRGGICSGLDNLDDLTLDPRYSAICGYTEADLDTVFAPELEGLDRHRMRDWYHGYNWSGDENVSNRSTSCCCSANTASTPTGSRPAGRRS